MKKVFIKMDSKSGLSLKVKQNDSVLSKIKTFLRNKDKIIF